jgi:hypothetical protein
MNRPRHTLYCFVEGGDLDEVAPLVERECRELASLAGWRYSSPEVVNRRHARTPEMRQEDLPVWELGVTLNLPEPGTETDGWFADVERVVLWAAGVRKEIGRDFVVGMWDAARRISEDLFDVDDVDPDFDSLRAVVGVGNAS